MGEFLALLRSKYENAVQIRVVVPASNHNAGQILPQQINQPTRTEQNNQEKKSHTEFSVVCSLFIFLRQGLIALTSLELEL